MGNECLGIVKYFQELTKWTPITEQEEILSLMTHKRKRNVAITAGRGFSKTTLGAVTGLWYIDEYASQLSRMGKGRDLTVMIVSSQKRLYSVLNRLIETNQERFGYNSSSKKYDRIKQTGVFNALMQERADIYTKDRKQLCTILPVMATSASARSNRADVIISDETAEHPRDVFVAYQGCFTGDINKFILLSTPHKEGSIFNEIVLDPSKYDFTVYNVSAEVASWQAEANKRAKRTLTPQEYAIEIIGRVPTKEERAFFPSEHIEKCIVDCEPFPEGGTTSWREVGLDWGYSSRSGTVYVCTERIGSVKRKILRIAYWKEQSIEEIAPEIAELLNIDQPLRIKADSRPEHYQNKVEPYAHRKITYIDGAEKLSDEQTQDYKDEKQKKQKYYIKDAMMGQLQRKLREKNLIIPIHGDYMRRLVEQLRKYRRGMDRGDDFVDGLALSCYEPLTGYKESTSCFYINTINNRINSRPIPLTREAYKTFH